MMKKGMIPILVAILMVFALMPVQMAFAEGNTTVIVDSEPGAGDVTDAIPDEGTYNVTLTANPSAGGMQDIDLRIEVPDKVYGDDVKCAIYASRDGEYDLKIDDRQTTITVRNHLAIYNAGVFDAGTYQAIISFEGDDNYKSAYNVDTFTVYPFGTSFEIAADPVETVYGEHVSITHKLPDGATGTIKYYLQDGTFLGELGVSESLVLPLLDARAYVVIAQYQGDYVFIPATDTALVTLKPADISAATVEASNQTYNGSALTPDPTVKLGYTELVKDTDYTVTSYDDNINAGSAAITVTGKGNYSGTATGAFTINRAPLTITAKDQTYTYNGQIQGEGDTAYEDPAEIAEKVTVKGLQNGDEITSLVLDGAEKEIGVYKDRIQITGFTINGKPEAKDNYNITLLPGTLTITKPQPKPEPKPEPKPVTKVSGTLLSKITAKGKSSLILTWSKVKGADGYDVFFAKCGTNISAKKVKTIKGNKTFKWTKKGLKAKKGYKAFVKAYTIKNGKKTYVRTGPMVHAYTSGGTSKYTNAKSVTVKKPRVSLKAGKTYKIKANVVKLQKGKKLVPTSHAPKLRYVSSNKKIATVSKSGKITAKSKGSCKVYVIAVNGASKAVSVTVK